MSTGWTSNSFWQHLRLRERKTRAVKLKWTGQAFGRRVQAVVEGQAVSRLWDGLSSPVKLSVRRAYIHLHQLMLRCNLKKENQKKKLVSTIAAARIKHLYHILNVMHVTFEALSQCNMTWFTFIVTQRNFFLCIKQNYFSFLPSLSFFLCYIHLYLQGTSILSESHHCQNNLWKFLFFCYWKLTENTHRHLWFQLQVLICINDTVVLERVLLVTFQCNHIENVLNTHILLLGCIENSLVDWWFIF